MYQPGYDEKSRIFKVICVKEAFKQVGNQCLAPFALSNQNRLLHVREMCCSGRSKTPIKILPA